MRWLLYWKGFNAVQNNTSLKLIPKITAFAFGFNAVQNNTSLKLDIASAIPTSGFNAVQNNTSLKLNNFNFKIKLKF